jgi:HEAT repeat protein
VRGEAAVALGKIADPAAAPALEAASREDNPVVRRDALLALARLDYPRHRQRVLDELLKSPLNTVRERAMALITAQRDLAALPAVLRALNPDDWFESALAVQYLNQFHKIDDPDALIFLSRVASIQGADSQGGALLARFADRDALVILRGWVRYDPLGASEAWEALARLKDTHSLPDAARLLEAERPSRARLHAAQFYASVGRAEGAALLLDTLENGPIEDKRIVSALLTGLNLDAFGLRTQLRKMLAHEDTYVRIAAARVLAHHGDPEADKRLKAELDKKIPFIHDEVIDTLQRLPDARRAALIQAWSQGATPLLREELAELAL